MSRGWMLLISTLARTMASAFWWRIMAWQRLRFLGWVDLLCVFVLWYYCLHAVQQMVTNFRNVYTDRSLKLIFHLHKTYLHLQFLLRFLVRFSSDDACERVNGYECSEYMYPRIHLIWTFIHSFTSTRRRKSYRSKNCKCKPACI
jgi:hypothetical protein